MTLNLRVHRSSFLIHSGEVSVCILDVIQIPPVGSRREKAEEEENKRQMRLLQLRRRHRRRQRQRLLLTYRFVKHARHPIFILCIGTIDESVTQHMIVDASVPAHSVGRGTGEPLHTVFHWGTLYKEKEGRRKGRPGTREQEEWKEKVGNKGKKKEEIGS